MIHEYSSYFHEASDAIATFSETLTGCQFDERTQAVEVFALQALAISRDHCRAISSLLQLSLFAEPIILSRSLFELYFALHWILRAATREEKLERTYQLEATPYHEFAKEVRLIEDDFNGTQPSWSPQKVKEFRAVLDKVKRESPFLLRGDVETGEYFKKAPPLTGRMSNKERLRFYQLYRFGSFFTHPTPSMKQVYLRTVGNEQSIPQLMEEPLKQTLAYTMLFVQNICRLCLQLFKLNNQKKSAIRESCHEILRRLLDQCNKGYFRTS